jgi:hypothetical protein
MMFLLSVIVDSSVCQDVFMVEASSYAGARHGVKGKNGCVVPAPESTGTKGAN